VNDFYGPGARALQDRFDTRRLADRLGERLVRDHLTDDDRAFVEKMDMFFLATVDAFGRPSCSYKGGEPGFVRVIDEKTIAFPSFDGNGMYLSMGNVADTRHVGLLFIDFEGQSRLRLEGEATIAADGERSRARSDERGQKQVVRFAACGMRATG
jgi:predicted pyridoxine 5'-phosphate oxidase superfamily flavin-nucleotide-binding protein